VFIDALDVLVEDYAAPTRGVRIIKTLLQRLRGLKGVYLSPVLYMMYVDKLT
jgi:hypothetical protein